MMGNRKIKGRQGDGGSEEEQVLKYELIPSPFEVKNVVQASLFMVLAQHSTTAIAKELMETIPPVSIFGKHTHTRGRERVCVLLKLNKSHHETLTW